MSSDEKDLMREGKAQEIIHAFSFNLKVLGDQFLLMKVKRPDFVNAVDELSRKTADSLNALYGHPPTAAAEKAKLRLLILNDQSKDAHVSIYLEDKQIGEGYAKNRDATEAGVPKGVTTRRVIDVTLEMPKDKIKRLLEDKSELPPEAK